MQRAALLSLCNRMVHYYGLPAVNADGEIMKGSERAPCDQQTNGGACGELVAIHYIKEGTFSVITCALSVIKAMEWFRKVC